MNGFRLPKSNKNTRRTTADALPKLKIEQNSIINPNLSISFPAKPKKLKFTAEKEFLMVCFIV